MKDFKWNSVLGRTVIIAVLLIGCTIWWMWPIILQTRCETVCLYNDFRSGGRHPVITSRCFKNCAWDMKVKPNR